VEAHTLGEKEKKKMKIILNAPFNKTVLCCFIIIDTSNSTTTLHCNSPITIKEKFFFS
jgi:hypothetical protein